MRKALFSLLLAGCLFSGAAFSQEDLNVPQVLQGLVSGAPEKRLQALEAARLGAYSLEDESARGQIRQKLFNWLDQETDADVRYQVASALESFLSHETTPSSDFVQAEAYLTDADPQVRHVFWLAFYQQASQKALTPEIEARLLALTDHPEQSVQLEAMSWAIEASQNRVRMVGSPQTPLGAKALKLFQERSEHPDPQVRNLAIYGVLSQFTYDPDGAVAVIKAHLADPHGDTRSLILDYLTQQGGRVERLADLQPVVLKRFRDRPEGGDFPLQADAELGPAANPPQSEVFRLATVLAVQGPLPDDVWRYLETEAVVVESPEMLLQIAELQGVPGRGVVSRLVQKFDPEIWLAWSSVLAATGLEAEQLDPVLEWLNNRPKPQITDDEFSDNFEVEFQTRMLLAVLARSGVGDPKVLEAATRYLASDVPGERAAAAYTLAVLDPKGPGGKAALETVLTSDWSELYTGTDYLLLAAYRLRDLGLRDAPPTLRLDHLDNDLLLGWLIGRQPESAAQPMFLEQFQNASVTSRESEPGTGDDSLMLKLEWLAAHPEPSALPGLRRLSEHADPQVQSAAKKALQSLDKAK